MCGIAQEATSDDEVAYTQPWHVTVLKVTTFIYYNLLLFIFLVGFLHKHNIFLPCRLIRQNHVLDPLWVRIGCWQQLTALPEQAQMKSLTKWTYAVVSQHFECEIIYKDFGS